MSLNPYNTESTLSGTGTGSHSPENHLVSEFRTNEESCIHIFLHSNHCMYVYCDKRYGDI